MSEELTEREMKAVNSEHSKNIESDLWREHHLLKVLAEPSAEFNSFNCGNLATLDQPGIREALLAFYDKYYSANLMKLTVVSS
jgi:insulysin